MDVAFGWRLLQARGTHFAETVRSEINRQSPNAVDFQDHSLLNARRSSDKSDAPFVEYLRALNVDQPPDLIVAIGAPAANFVQAHRKDLFPTTPMLFTRGRATPRGLRQVDRIRHGGGDFQQRLFSLKISCAYCPSQRPLPSYVGASPSETFWRNESRQDPPRGSPTACNFDGTMNFPSKICSRTRPTFRHTAQFFGLD